MVPIIKSQQDGYEAETFVEDVTQKALNSIKEKKILTHCIFIYSHLNPIAVKLLNDNIFYEALNDISGEYVNIYHAESEIRETITKPYRTITTKPNRNSNNGQFIEMLVNIDSTNYRESKKINSVVNNLNKMFSLNINTMNPGLLFFQLDTTNKNIENTFYYELTESSVEDLFHDIKKIINIIVGCICDVKIENIDNQFEIFHLYLQNLKSHKIYYKLCKITSHPFVNILSIFKP
ncbi:MAG: hypothetical protein FWD47_14615 [Treponema sp.]|nr:hypothetical protein [Treponema sp.]